MREAFGASFDVPDGYLNTPGRGIPPRFEAEALRRDLEDWATGRARTERYDEAVRQGRSAYARLVGVPPASVAIGASVSALLGLVAASVPDGARVLTVRHEFTSVTFPFAAQRARGVTVTEAAPDELAGRAAGFDVVAVSVVQSADGAVTDLAALRRAVAGTGTVVVLDATQALGWMDLDLSWAQVTVGDGYKWLLAPRGAAWMSVGDDLAGSLTPLAANWYAAEDHAGSVYGLPLRLAPDARRLDTSPAWASHLGAGLTLPWLASLDRPAVQAHAVGLAAALRRRLGMAEVPSPIVAIRRPDAAERLAAAGVVASARAGAVRVGFHLYNDERDLDLVLGALGL